MRANLPIAILSLIGVAAAAAAGCSATLTIGSATPPGVSFVGPGGAIIDFGASCTGLVYYADGSAGWAYCDSGVWAYTLTDPSTDGYAIYGGGGGGGGGDGGGPGGGDGGGGGDGAGGGGDGGGGGGDGAGGGGDGGGGGGGDGGGGGGGGG